MLLNDLPVDLVELSGGSYESPAMQGRTADGRTLAREAYFLEFAQTLAAVALMPVMTTGGIARQAIAEQVLASGVAVVGIATALTLAPDLPQQWRAGAAPLATAQPVQWKDKVLGSLATMAVVRRRLRTLGAKGGTGTSGIHLNPLFSLVLDQLRASLLTRRYRKWRTQSAR